MLNTATDLHDDNTWFLAGARGLKAGPRLVALCDLMANDQSTLLANTKKCIAIFQWGGDARACEPGDHFPIEDNLVAFNQAKNTVETVHAKVCKAEIAPMPLTNGGGYLARQRAKELGKAIEGVLAENNVDTHEREAMLDALSTDHGAGAVKLVECDDRIEISHIPIEDVWYDAAEVRQGRPRCCYHVPEDGEDIYVVLEQFACDDDAYPGLVGTAESRRRAIIAAGQNPAPWRTSKSGGAHRIDIYEAWHRPSGRVEEAEEEYEDEETGEKKSRRVVRHDGRHVVAVRGEEGTLIDEPWDGEGGFPIYMIVPRRRRRHVLGMSIMRDLIAPQREYEKLTKKIQSAHQKMGVSGWHTAAGAELNVREITAGTFGQAFVVETNSQTPPTPLVPEPVAAGTYAYKDSIPRDMNERNGVSTLATSSQLPAGMQQASGKALQTFEDFEDVRLMPYHRAREDFKIALSWGIVCAAKRICDRTGSMKSRYRGKHGLETIDWKEVLIDKEDLDLRVFPVSELSKQPAAKFAQLTEMLQNGAITIEQFKRLFQIPDLESELDIDTATTDIIDRNLDLMVVKGRYIAVEPIDDPDLILQRAGKFYQLCRQQEVPENRLKLLRDYMQDAKNMKAKLQAAQPPPPMTGPPGMTPPAGPLPGMPPPMPPGPPMPPPGTPPMPMAA